MWAIVDCNSFYCSCERVFRPELQHRPMVVLSNNDGCIIARTDEAKLLGLDMTGPYFLARDIIEKNEVAVFSSNYNLYGDMSWRVMEVLKRRVGAHHVEVYSVDEAFVKLEGFAPEQVAPLARQLRNEIEQWTGIRVSIGVAPTKTLSKLANRLAKQDKLVTQCIAVLDTPGKIAEALKQTPPGKLWGVGRQYGEKLKAMGIDTAWQLRNLPEEWARRNLGGVVGVRLIRELNGRPAIELEEQLKKKKMIATTRMFVTAVGTVGEIKEAVASYAARAAEKLRRQQSAASVLHVFLIPKQKLHGPQFSHGATVSANYILPQPTSVTSELIKPAVQMAAQLFEEGKLYKKAGVVLSGLVPDASIQANLFQPSQRIGRLLMQMVDNINFSMRDDVVKFAATGTRRNWKMQQNFHSPRYTTRWEELCRVG